MSFAMPTLERLVAKEAWLETRYLRAELLATLDSSAERSRIKVLAQDSHFYLATPGSISSSLEPLGSSFIAMDSQVFALSHHPQTLTRWNLAEPQQSQSLNLESPATGLSMHPQWIAWIGLHQNQRYACYCLPPLLQGRPQLFWLFEDVPYAFSWHPQEAYCLALLVPREHTPWSGARLMEAAYTAHADGPRLLREELIAPPSPAGSICLEAHYSPCGQEIVGLWQTGEWYQLWALERVSKRWRQLSSGDAERALPRRRFDTRSLALTHHHVFSLKQQRGYMQLEPLARTQRHNSAPDDLALPGAAWPLAVDPLPGWSALKQIEVSPDASRICLIGSSAQAPPEVIELIMRADHLQVQRQHSPLRATSTLQAESLSWASDDGQMIHGLLYRDRSRTSPAPLLLPIHGGPTEQVLATWPVKAQAFVERGYAVLYVNFRGSWGYGRSYQQALGGSWGEIDVLDIVSSLRSLAAAGWIDPQRVAIWGGGWGGSTALRCIQRFPKLFRAAIAVYPICDFNDYHQRASLLQKAELNWALGSAGRRELMSPLSWRHDLQVPLALFHGARDPLVPLAHIQALSESLQARRVPCWTTIYPDEAHSWKSRTTLEDYYCKIASFLARFLRAGPVHD